MKRTLLAHELNILNKNMPIILSEPITRIINDIGDTFEVEHAVLFFTQKYARFLWRVKTSTGSILKQGEVVIKDEQDNPNFTNWYNTGYKTHADLVNKVAELAGFTGVFNDEALI